MAIQNCLQKIRNGPERSRDLWPKNAHADSLLIIQGYADFIWLGLGNDFLILESAHAILLKRIFLLNDFWWQDNFKDPSPAWMKAQLLER